MLVTEDKFQQHIHVFRGIAIILIICAHTVPSLDWASYPILGKFIDAVANESSIFFFFIAGYLFQHLSARFSFKSYLKQKVKTVISPYLLLSIPALIIFTLFAKRTGMWSWFYDLPVWEQVGLFLITGKHLAPLWFVPTITLFYLCAPIFLFIDRRFRPAYWVIAPLVVLSTILGRDGYFGPINKALYLLPFYMFGMVFCRYKIMALEITQRWSIVLVAIASLGFVASVLEWSSPPYWQVIIKFPMAALITWLLWRYHHFIGTRLNYIAEVSFGIFFVHAYFISALKVLAVYVLTGHIYNGEGSESIEGTPITFVVYVGLVLGASVFLIWVVKKLFGKRSRMLIGA